VVKKRLAITNSRGMAPLAMMATPAAPLRNLGSDSAIFRGGAPTGFSSEQFLGAQL